ncbi:MAG TPA: LysE family translocator [Zoogloea sp.]|uniref:LysE family translocator n=1 Tax=Zoogloea sp. TaxID=49181 RepID=UPI002D081157|nr:LysE family translocator [Zoogloea sp.]HNI47914.1 LysE family translocator [Zoogloea sp.]
MKLSEQWLFTKDLAILFPFIGPIMKLPHRPTKPTAVIDTAALPLFLAALAAAYLLPGPDMALIVSTTARHGPRSGLMAAAGLALSRSLHVLLSGFGLAALFAAHPLLFHGVKLLGAAYLLGLAWTLLTAPDTTPGATAAAACASLPGAADALRRGFLTNLLNPKALGFCAILLPQFVAPHQPLPGQFAVLGLILVGLGAAFDAAYICAAQGVARRFAAAPRLRGLSRLTCAGVFGLAALRLAFSGTD